MKIQLITKEYFKQHVGENPKFETLNVKYNDLPNFEKAINSFFYIPELETYLMWLYTLDKMVYYNAQGNKLTQEILLNGEIDSSTWEITKILPTETYRLNEINRMVPGAEQHSHCYIQEESDSAIILKERGIFSPLGEIATWQIHNRLTGETLDFSLMGVQVYFNSYLRNKILVKEKKELPMNGYLCREKILIIHYILTHLV